MKKVVVIRPNGFCGNKKGFGVRRSIFLAQKTAKRFPGKTYLLGEIVHNQHLVDRLEKEYRLKTVQRLEDIPQGSTVIIRAHGADPSVYKRAGKMGLNLVDATCPLVARVHQEVRRLTNQGKKILYLASDKNHDEAVAVAGEAPGKIKLITINELDKIKIDNPQKTVVLTQTTLSILETEESLKKLKQKYPATVIKPHICLATTKRQKAVIQAAKKHGLVVIVGSPTSSNSNRLREVAEAAGAKAFIVDRVDELDPKWFSETQTVAVGSGASTPDWILDEVVVRIKGF